MEIILAGKIIELIGIYHEINWFIVYCDRLTNGEQNNYALTNICTLTFTKCISTIYTDRSFSFPVMCCGKMLNHLKTVVLMVSRAHIVCSSSFQLIHSSVVDTAIVFPHRLGLPYKRALKNLMADYLKRIIQDNGEKKQGRVFFVLFTSYVTITTTNSGSVVYFLRLHFILLNLALLESSFIT